MRSRATSWMAFLALPLESVATGWGFLGGSLMELFWKAAGVFLVFGCGGSVSPDAPLQAGPAHEQAGDQGRDQGSRRQSADEGPDSPSAARPRAPQHDEGRAQGDRRGGQPHALSRWPSATRWKPWPRRWWSPRARTIWRCASARVAVENQVPIIENPPLAQALYKSVEVGQEIPPHLYRAVAEILAYIFKLMNGRLPG